MQMEVCVGAGSLPMPRSLLLLAAIGATAAVKCDAMLRTLFATGSAVDPKAVATACSPTVEWVDMGLKDPIRGPDEVEAHLARCYPPGSQLVVEKLADGTASGGFSWRREAEGVDGSGLRGVTYVEMDATGRIAYVQEGYEPIFKPGKGLELLFKLVGKLAEKNPTPKPKPAFRQATPRDASGIVKYLWTVAYPGGAEPSEALRFFADDIFYEDFNYPKPFVGIDAVAEYIGLLPDFPNVEFVLDRCSQGRRGCCFTWKVVVNGADGPSGISFKEVDAKGKICFNRDIPAPSIRPPPIGRLAARLRPKLRVFRRRTE